VPFYTDITSFPSFCSWIVLWKIANTGDRSNIQCPQQRSFDDILIVPGGVGTGSSGLCHTVPPAIEGRSGVIVYGHGVFTVGRNDFNETFHHLLRIENNCRKEYFRLIGL
jgi:ribulose-5-phosphate 4-epimerase/fuculose-1-phosphate aldolase